jgi:hypothetical protein
MMYTTSPAPTNPNTKNAHRMRFELIPKCSESPPQTPASILLLDDLVSFGVDTITSLLLLAAVA